MKSFRNGHEPLNEGTRRQQTCSKTTKSSLVRGWGGLEGGNEICKRTADAIWYRVFKILRGLLLMLYDHLSELVDLKCSGKQ